MTTLSIEKIAGILRKHWDPEKVQKYIGSYERSWFAFASSESIREGAASGGVTTALLAFLLKEKNINGALVCRSVVTDGKVRPEFFITESEKGLLDAQGSKYIAVDFIQDALPLIRSFKGKLAVVALPCDTTNIRRACNNDPELKKKIVMVLSLFCVHNSLPDLIDLVIHKLTPPDSIMTDFRFRQGHWRGRLRADFDNGLKQDKPFSFFSDYQNLYFFCQQKCHHCSDHTGYNGDISFGDIWLLSMKDNPIKHNAVITRTPAGDSTFQRALDADMITAKLVAIDEVCAGQTRSLPFHYNVSARSKAGLLLGFKIKDTVHEKVRWNEFLGAWIALFNEKLSRTVFGKKLIRMLPRIILKFFLFVKKGLESF